jgi:hypothetical protein
MDTLHRTTLAQLAALVARALEAAPELGTRPEKAACILLAGKVSETAPGSYEVVNSDGDGTYTVDHSAGTCTCPDFQHRAPTVNGAKLCKHRLAVLFLRKLGCGRKQPTVRQARVASFRRCVARRPMRRAA